MNTFDFAGKVAFDTTAAIMGYDAEWTPLAGGAAKTARVHFKNPASPAKLGGKEYDVASDGVIEYLKGSFDGLRESVDKNEPEVIKVNINGTWTEYVTVKDKKLFDGQTIEVKVTKK